MRRWRATTILAVGAWVALLLGLLGRHLSADTASSVSGWREAACALPHRWVELTARGWYEMDASAGDLILFRDPPANHSGPQEVLQSIPLVFYGPGLIEAGDVKLEREVTLADIGPTTAAMLGMGFDAPDGRVLDEVLPRDGKRPRVIVTVVMDGGGLNTLAQWPDSTPHVDELMRDGANVLEAKVGSSPSVTTSVHASISTGAFPSRHGITGLFQRNAAGDVIPAFSLEETSPMHEAHPRNLRLPTVADLWDLENGNRAEIGYVAAFNYPLGMLGHGSAHPGGDKDIAVIGARRRWETATPFYSLPTYVREMRGFGKAIDALDREDGERDGKWLESEQAFTRLDALPIHPPWQNRAMKAVLEREGFGRDSITDLMYVNYKPMDMSAHFWSLDSPQEGRAVEAVDGAIGDLVDWLNRRVGEGRYVVVLTADHGGIPLETDVFPYDADKVMVDLDARLDRTDNGIGLLDETTPTVFFVNREELERNGLTPEDLADHLVTYPIRDGAPPGREISEDFEGDLDDPLFKAVVPGSRLDEVLECTRPG